VAEHAIKVSQIPEVRQQVCGKGTKDKGQTTPVGIGVVRLLQCSFNRDDVNSLSYFLALEGVFLAVGTAKDDLTILKVLTWNLRLGT